MFSPRFNAVALLALNLGWWSHCLFDWENKSSRWRSWSSRPHTLPSFPGGRPCSGLAGRDSRTFPHNYTLSFYIVRFLLWKHSHHHSKRNSKENTFLTTTHFHITFSTKTPQKSSLCHCFPLSSLPSPLKVSLACWCLSTASPRHRSLRALAPGAWLPGLLPPPSF